jgi:hypothetical protein
MGGATVVPGYVDPALGCDRLESVLADRDMLARRVVSYMFYLRALFYCDAITSYQDVPGVYSSLRPHIPLILK